MCSWEYGIKKFFYKMLLLEVQIFFSFPETACGTKFKRAACDFPQNTLQNFKIFLDRSLT